MLITKGAVETKKMAAKLAKEILKTGPDPKHARVVALVGDLGAGKTTFTQGFAKALGIQNRMTSPTFLIFRNYDLPSSLRASAKQSFHTFFHMDAYRIDSLKELAPLGFKEALRDPGHIFLIEWADRIKKLLPKDTIWIVFKHGKDQNKREVSLRGAKRRGNLTI